MAIATRHSWREIQESSLRSINFDRVIRMLSFFKQGKKREYLIGQRGYSESPENPDYLKLVNYHMHIL